ncbi:hypothetical protein BJ875DRAFT_505902 [Amylocarpus encephaloides]|uniref:WW domain-containing protein n=1 Tax=Amylocarpus encephaloides TaxID=45428 RepID=A0A9P8C3X6_9HELO|nr:hypothetical protein BJ875DRAFT_505902 [Amylocarpus encephaloides]
MPPSDPPLPDFSRLQAPYTHRIRNDIPPSSMEDEARSLPHGWVCQFDGSTQHQFFVNTLASPPRAIWHHPYDDSDDPDTNSKHRLRPREEKPAGVKKYAWKVKDKLTSSTHEEREITRQRRADDERATYERHQMIRQRMARAMETGQPQFLGKNKEGIDVYIELPQQGVDGYGMSGYPGQMGYGGGEYGSGAGPYAPGAMVVRPGIGYRRPYGGGHGGGVGLPLMGGLASGVLLGALIL